MKYRFELGTELGGFYDKEYNSIVDIDLDELIEELKEADKGATYDRNLLASVVNKMEAIENNLPVLYEQAKLEAKRTDATEDGEPVNEKWNKEAEDLFIVGSIGVDLHWAIDEFLLRYTDGIILPNSCCSVEVVTKEVAEENDMCWITGTPELSEEDRKNYKVGEILSDYRKLGDSGYYFKFM